MKESESQEEGGAFLYLVNLNSLRSEPIDLLLFCPPGLLSINTQIHNNRGTGLIDINNNNNRRLVTLAD